MSLLPYVLDRFWPAEPDHFGFGIWPDDLLISPAERSLMRKVSKLGDKYWQTAISDLSDMEKKTHIGKDGFQVCLDVQHFAPNEIAVKTIENSIIVEAKHEERRDNDGYISRQFCRRYDLPEGFKVEDVVSNISSDGILTIKAPPANAAIEGPKERHVQIQHTGPAHLSIKKNEKIDKKEKKEKEKKEKKEKSK